MSFANHAIFDIHSLYRIHGMLYVAWHTITLPLRAFPLDKIKQLF